MIESIISLKIKGKKLDEQIKLLTKILTQFLFLNSLLSFIYNNLKIQISFQRYSMLDLRKE